MTTMEDRWKRRRASVEKWKSAHREYYLEQKRRLARRPEYLAHRREMYRAKKARSASERRYLSASKSYDFEEANEGSDYSLYREPEPASSTPLGDWPGVA